MIIYAISRTSEIIAIADINVYSFLEEAKQDHAELEKEVPGRYKIYKVTTEVTEVKE